MNFTDDPLWRELEETLASGQPLTEKHRRFIQDLIVQWRILMAQNSEMIREMITRLEDLLKGD